MNTSKIRIGADTIMKESRVKIIVVTGVESSGKTTLTQALAEQFNEPWLDETARDYLAERNGNYTFEDIEKIAQLHTLRMQSKVAEAKNFLFVDTAYLVLKIWSEEKYGQCSNYILNRLATFAPAAYLLCDIDIPWEADDLREHPNTDDRRRLNKIYLSHLQEQAQPFVILSGTKKERLEKAAQFINSL